MRRLALPAHAPAGVISACIGGVAEPTLTAKLRAIEPTLVATAANYDTNARAKTLDLVPRVHRVGAVSTEELKSLYTAHMSATNGAARSVYNALRNAAANGKCPLCGIGNVTVLDHHLPQSKYPDLAVCPFNLVPACDFCNNAKRARFPRSAGEQTIHPYYDDFTLHQWIHARLDAVGSPALVYFVNPPPHWTATECTRAQRHFDVVKLGQSYTSNANDDLISLRDHLATIEATKGSAGIQAYLDEEAVRYASRLNSWQHVMYQTLAQNGWFVGGGYRQIPH